MNDEPVGSLAAGTMEPLGVEQIEEEVIAGVLIHQVVDRKVQG
jgi:hypothetical protein